MFTGLVEGAGKIAATSRVADGLRLSVTSPFDLAEVKLGDSIAVSGPCLTVVELAGKIFAVDVSAETLARTNLSLKKVGSRVNLERALRLGDRLGGHLVSGHIDCLGILMEKVAGPQSLRLKFSLPSPWARYIIEKGSIAIDGVSLTVNACGNDWFTVNIIPYTAQHTTIIDLGVGDRVNLETDIIGKYVEKLLGPKATPADAGVTAEFLARHGFF
jgi:riboflavin synthase